MSRKSPAQRQRYREKQTAKRVVYDALCAELRKTGASCGSCRHWEKVPMMRGEHHCSIESDFHGYAIKATTDICPEWGGQRKEKTDARET